MPPTFKSQEIIYNEMKASIQADIPEITNWSSGSITRAILSVVSAAIRLLYIVLQQLYFNMFPQSADRECLQRYYEEWGLPWGDPTTDIARATVLGKYRENAVIGTKLWYEDQVKAQFAIVNGATLRANLRGPGTADLIVSHNNLPIFQSDITLIEAYFNQDANKVIGMDLKIRTVGEPSSESL